MRGCPLDGTGRSWWPCPSSRVDTARDSLPASGYAGGRRGQKRGSREGREVWLMGQVEERGD